MTLLLDLKDKVHIWITQLNISQKEIEHGVATLSLDEKTRCNRFVKITDRNNFIASHAFTRQILGKYLSQMPQKIQFSQSTFGKPYLVLPNNRIVGLTLNEDLHFNLSHSHNLAILAICNKGEVGVDLEYIKPLFEWGNIAKEFFTLTEQKALFSLPAELQTHAFFQTWTRKESIMKVTGQGLNLSPTAFQVSIPPESAKFLGYVIQENNPELPQSWVMQDLVFDIMKKDYCACLSAENNYKHLQFFTPHELQLIY